MKSSSTLRILEIFYQSMDNNRSQNLKTHSVYLGEIAVYTDVDYNATKLI